MMFGEEDEHIGRLRILNERVNIYLIFKKQLSIFKGYTQI